MSKEAENELRERLAFSEKIVVEPYEEVKSFLDEMAKKTAKKSTESIAEMFEVQYGQ